MQSTGGRYDEGYIRGGYMQASEVVKWKINNLTVETTTNLLTI